eukprot:gb/GFBE01042186.1/.p1 GENE.gb/GFBE01042186.1/~~gb/GFBE01042186.1/.p1  ORF type:complete len:350 (+),score=51.33 gb/GFBE01042186.1/:1-1050(+)
MAGRRRTAKERCVHGAVGLALLCMCLQGVEHMFACQKPLNWERDRAGFGFHASAYEEDANRYELTSDEKRLVSRITESGRRGNWIEAWSLFSCYDGCANPVYNAAMTAALRCGRFQEGVDIYKNMCNSGIPKTKPTYTVAIKLYAKLRHQDSPDKVQQLWDEALNSSMIDHVLVGARIDAAAVEGDVLGAASLLDLMYKKQWTPGLLHWTSAISACKNSEPPSFNTSLFLLNRLVHASVTPDIVTYSSVIAAHRNAPVEKIKAIRARMAEEQVEINKVFVETYVMSAFQGRIGADRRLSIREAVRLARGISKDRLEEVASLIEEARRKGVKLTQAVNLVRKALVEIGVA